MIEVKVDNCKLILRRMGTFIDLDNRIEAKQMKRSLIQYASSKSFNSSIIITEKELLKFKIV